MAKLIDTDILGDLNVTRDITTSKLITKGATSGTTTLQATATASGVLTLPAATDTLVGKNTVDILTNKTLTDPIASKLTITNGDATGAFTKEQLKLGYNGTSDYAQYIHTRHTTSSSTNAIDFYTSDGVQAGVYPTNAVHNISLYGGKLGVKNTTPTELLTLGTAGTTAGVISLAGATSGKIIINVPAVAGSGTLTLPAATDTLVGRDTTDTLTNKTLTSPTLTTPVLGTPSSGTLTNCTGLPVSGITASTSTAIGVGSIELGHASDTTIARVSAGVISVEGVTIDTVSAANTLTNKRITKRVSTEASNATPAINSDSYDMHTITALAAAATFGAPTGTPTEGQLIMYRIKDNGTARALSWNAIYRASTDLALPTTTVISKTMYVGFIYNSTDSKWDLLSTIGGF